MKKLLSLILCCALICSLAIPSKAATTFTAENPDILSTVWHINMSPRAVFPSGEANLPYNANIPKLEAEHYTYTSYYFCPGDTDLRILGTMYASAYNCNDNNRVRFTLFEKKTSNSVEVGTYTTDAFARNGAAIVAHTFTGLNPNSFYFISIANTASKEDAESSNVNGSFLVD